MPGYPLSSFLIFQVDGCISKFGSTNQCLSIQPYCERYITKSYFNKCDSLVDSDFLDFIAHALLPGSCEVLLDNLNFAVGLSVQHRALIGDGSHRRLSSSFRFDIQSESMAELPIDSCEAIIIERLPYGIFADPFELQHLLQRGGKIYFESFKQLWAFFNPYKIWVEPHVQCLWMQLFLETQIWKCPLFIPTGPLLRFTWMLISTLFHNTRMVWKSA